MSDAIESTAEELGTEPERPHGQTLTLSSRPALAVTPSVQAEELVERLAVIRKAMDSAMQEGVDYGRIPGVDKPALLKPGSEKLGVLFQLDVQLVNEKTWGPGDHLTVMSKATVYHAPSGARLGFGEGLCSTRERKYGKRKQERTCPACGAAAVIKGKQEYGGGWLCWKRRDGCGAKFPEGDPQIEDQPTGDVENPDIPDTWNTVVKMAEKRARVDAVLAVTGASALFTQDVEDIAPPAQPAMGSTPATAAQKAAVRREFTRLSLPWADIKALFGRVGADAGDDPQAAVDGLLKHHASALLDLLKQGAVPSGESDVPSDASGFERGPVTPEQIAEAFDATDETSAGLARGAAQ